MRRLLMLFFAVLLAGCSTMADQLHGSLQPPAGTGYAVFSMTVRTLTPDHAWANLSWRGLDNNRHGMLYSNFATDTVFGEEGMPPADGKLQLLALPPGRYRLQDSYAHWVDDPGDNPVFNYKGYAVFHLNKDFEVKAGQTVYLGNIRFNLDNLPDVVFGSEQRRDFGHMKRVWKVSDLNAVLVQPYSGSIKSGSQ
ncbi:hypothetical protein [Vogesella sp. LIG4]|uniref:hypothetical protein n=1 Tax=Vogesella sp. LIG4 TaxID=1192162 RepID=UPI000820128D|nr:hypothetical protein [Vogesella sp. LIG4]SCK25771.1 hypothetical protein PSELUDRAFT_3081 [Vogesella sp. LIG4]